MQPQARYGEFRWHDAAVYAWLPSVYAEGYTARLQLHRSHACTLGEGSERNAMSWGLGLRINPVSVTSSDVCMPLISSTSFITGTGFIKCMPTWTAVQQSSFQQSIGRSRKMQDATMLSILCSWCGLRFVGNLVQGNAAYGGMQVKQSASCSHKTCQFTWVWY